MENKLKWFVEWYEEVQGWAVMKGNFRDSWDKSKFLAKQRTDELNKEDLKNG